VQNITLETREGTEIEFNGRANSGNSVEEPLKDGEIIVGLKYGESTTLDTKPITGLTFIVWSPIKDKE